MSLVQLKLIEVKDLKKYFSSGMFRKSYVKAIDGISFKITNGETFALVGESGCGKSTLGRCILRLITPNSGQIYFKGINILDSNKREIRRLRKNMQIIFQDADATLNPRMKVIDLILEPLRIHQLLNINEKEKALQLIEMVHLSSDILHRFPGELSGGQRQRVGIARAMALTPEFVVADEPAASLDLSVQAQIIGLMKRLQAEFGISYLFISHNLRVVKLIADKIAVMYLGKFLEIGDARKIFDNPAHFYTKALLSAVSTNDPLIRIKRTILKGEIPSPINPPSGCRFHTRCPGAQKICADVEPVLCEIEDKHLVACHHASF